MRSPDSIGATKILRLFASTPFRIRMTGVSIYPRVTSYTTGVSSQSMESLTGYCRPQQMLGEEL